MAEPPITKPNAVTFSLEDIVGAVLEGRVRIPDFQRQFRWKWEDVRRLLDSIVRGYPIGSLLLWSRPAKAAELSLGALQIDAPNTEEALWVVDGQQRLISLANALNDAGSKDSRFAFSYDLADEAFKKAAEDRSHAIPLPVIFDLQRLLRWFAQHTESGEYFDEATRVAKAIRQYAIPAYIVKQQDEAVLRDIFDRMNNYGKRLTLAEVFSALHAGEGREGPPRTLADVVELIDTRHGFGEIDEDTSLRCVLARRGHDVTRDIRVEFSGSRVSREFPDESPDEAYRGGEEATSRAVAFLQQEAGVPHFSFLTYRYLLVVLTRFFAHHPDPGVRNRELLRRFFWRAALAGPAGFGGWTEAMRVLASHVKPHDEGNCVQSLLKAIEPFSLTLPAIGSFRSTTARSRMLLCAMWAQEPRSVLTGEPYDPSMIARDLQGRKTAGDIVFTILGREASDARSRAANRLLLLGEDLPEAARSFLVNPPVTLSPELWTAVLESHCLSSHLCSLLATSRYEEFLAEREALLASTVGDFLATQTESDFEDTPPLDSLDLDEEEGEGGDEEDAGS